MSKNVIIKGSSITKLEELSLTRKNIESLIETCTCGYDSVQGSTIEALANALGNVAQALSTIDTSNSNISITNCTFSGLQNGIMMQTSPMNEECEDDEYEEIDNDETTDDEEIDETTVDVIDEEAELSDMGQV